MIRTALRFLLAPSLDESDLTPSPWTLFHTWRSRAARREPLDATAMTLATCDPEGRPSARVVLLKSCDEQGPVFFTNFLSRKGHEIGANPQAALCIHWPRDARQVRLEGVLEAVSDAEADAYFASRPRGSQLGAWASMQSSELPDRMTLLQRLQDMEKRFSGQSVPRPPHWSGYRMWTRRIEFWQGRADRLHDRFLYLREPGTEWKRVRLAP